MKIWRVLPFSLLLLLLAVGCAANGLEKSNTLRVVIQADSYSKTISNSNFVQTLYEKTYGLPQVSPYQICPAIAGPKYTLTFINNGKIILAGLADASECGSFTIDKKNIRQTDQAFWSLIQQALAIGVSN